MCLLSLLSKLGFIALVLIPASWAQASLEHRCGAGLAQGVEYRWCIDSDNKSGNPDVLYYFHGAGRNEQSWTTEKDNQDIQQEWKNRSVAPPTVITVSFGKGWLFADRNQTGGLGLYTIFVNTIMPTLEAKIGGVQGRRMVKGESMGGFNASQLLLKSSHLFDRIALLCPAIPTVGPFAPPWELAAFLGRNRGFVKPELVIGLQLWTMFEYQSPVIWENHNPLNLVRRMTANAPRLFVTCGDRDEFGFFEGTQNFVRIAKERGVRVNWQPMKGGGHCVHDARSVAAFLAPL